MTLPDKGFDSSYVVLVNVFCQFQWKFSNRGW